MSQLITISAFGSLRSLQFKRGRGVDLRGLGKAKITRTTLIEWSEDNQMWYIRWVNECKPWEDSTFLGAGIDPLDQAGFLMPVGQAPLAVCFMEYDDAVDAEIAVVQALRRRGDNV